MIKMRANPCATHGDLRGLVNEMAVRQLAVTRRIG